MREYESSIRNSVRAIIVEGPDVLLLRKQDDDGSERYSLPGGAQDPGETLEQALQRECLEEIDCRVRVQRLAAVGDWFKRRSRPPHQWRHQVEFLFHCSVPADYRPANGPHPDRHQVEVVWRPRANLEGLRLLPRRYVRLLQDDGADPGAFYLGCID